MQYASQSTHVSKEEDDMPLPPVIPFVTHEELDAAITAVREELVIAIAAAVTVERERALVRELELQALSDLIIATALGNLTDNIRRAKALGERIERVED